MSLSLVLDTNVVLDILIFGDPEAVCIAEAVASGRALCFTDEECRAELARVLAYPQFALDPSSMQHALARYDGFTRYPSTLEPELKTKAPRCGDPDDQKFLDLAYRCNAHFLLTKDRALLDLARRTHDRPRITTPAVFAQLTY